MVEQRRHLVFARDGGLYELDPETVVRDWGSAYPVGPNEWASMAENGQLGRFNACELLRKDGRELIARSIIVRRVVLNAPTDEDDDGAGAGVGLVQYVWYVRLALKGVLTRGSEFGRDVIWPLCANRATEFYDRLANDESQVNSSLVTDYEPSNRSSEPCSWLLPGEPLQRVSELSVRLFCASVQSRGICTGTTRLSGLHAPANSEAAGRFLPPEGPGCRPPPPTRRSARHATPSLVEALSPDVLDIVLRRAVPHPLVPVHSLRVHGLKLRLVSKQFDAHVRDRLARHTMAILHMMRCVRTSERWLCVSTARDRLGPACIHALHAAEEQRVFDERHGARRRQDFERMPPEVRRALLLVGMRLTFSKAPGALPPRREPRNDDHLVMSRRHGVPAPERGHLYGTRRATHGIVRLRMRVPWCHVSCLELRGWHVVGDEWVGPVS